MIQILQETKGYATEVIFKAEHISEVEGDQGKTGASAHIEQDMLFDEEYYDLIFVINKAEQTKGWLKEICGKVSRFVQSMPFDFLRAGKVVLLIRTKIIWYGDIYLDGDNAISESEYFWIPDGCRSFERYIQSEEAISGCDKPESGIEALCLATEYLSDSKAKFGIIILCSEFGAYDIEMLQKRGRDFSSKFRPTDTSEFISGWNDYYVEMLGERYVKQIEGFSEHDITKWRYCGCTIKNISLILITPPKYPWNEFEFCLDRCIRVDRFEDAMKYGIKCIRNNHLMISSDSE